MLEIMLGRAKKALTGTAGRSIRLLALAGGRGSVGVFEFELLDSTGRNLCRTAGFVPATSYSPGATGAAGDMVTYPPSKTIDGISSGDWRATCYMACKADGSSWLQYDFPQDIVIDKWRMMAEGTWIPTPTGMKIQLLTAQGWKDIIAGTSDKNDWTTGWRMFSNLSVAP